jgi:aspartate/methionine/tyrosine aminotransferase
VEATGVLLLPSTTFGSGDSHFRIGLGRTDIPAALTALDAFLGQGA